MRFHGLGRTAATVQLAESGDLTAVSATRAYLDPCDLAHARPCAAWWAQASGCVQGPLDPRMMGRVGGVLGSGAVPPCRSSIGAGYHPPPKRLHQSCGDAKGASGR